MPKRSYCGLKGTDEHGQPRPSKKLLRVTHGRRPTQYRSRMLLERTPTAAKQLRYRARLARSQWVLAVTVHAERLVSFLIDKGLLAAHEAADRSAVEAALSKWIALQTRDY